MQQCRASIGGLAPQQLRLIIRLKKPTTGAESQCRLVPQLCPAVPSGEKGESEREGRKKASEHISLSPCLVIVHTPPHANPSASGFFIISWHASNSWEVLSLSEEKATWLPAREGEEGNGDRVVMRWTSQDKVSCVYGHLRRDQSVNMPFK